MNDETYVNVDELLRENKRLFAENERLEDGLHQIVQWSKAYPLDIFPEPDLDKAATVLKENGMTLGAISASNMRHVVTSVGVIAAKALARVSTEPAPVSPKTAIEKDNQKRDGDRQT